MGIILSKIFFYFCSTLIIVPNKKQNMSPASSKKGNEYFENAPIILSILQFRYKRIEGFNTNEFKKKGVQIASEYPQMRERFIQQIHFGGINQMAQLMFQWMKKK